MGWTKVGNILCWFLCKHNSLLNLPTHEFQTVNTKKKGCAFRKARLNHMPRCRGQLRRRYERKGLPPRAYQTFTIQCTIGWMCVCLRIHGWILWSYSPIDDVWQQLQNVTHRTFTARQCQNKAQKIKTKTKKKQS